MNALDQLRDEHAAVRMMLSIWRMIAVRLEKGGSVSADDLENLVAFMKGFVDKCHHKKEEGYLFPALMMFDNPRIEEMVKVLTQEHARLHNLVQDLDRALEGYKKEDPRAKQKFIASLKDYIVILTDHESMETTVLFEEVEKLLPDEVKERLFKDFNRVELEHVGAGRHEQFHQMLDKLNRVYQQKLEANTPGTFS